MVKCDKTELSLAKTPFEKRLRERFPRMGGLRSPASIAHVLEQATLALQAQAGCPVSFSRTTATQEPGVFQVVVQYTEKAVGRLALMRAEQLCRAALDAGAAAVRAGRKSTAAPLPATTMKPCRRD